VQRVSASSLSASPLPSPPLPPVGDRRFGVDAGDEHVAGVVPAGVDGSDAVCHTPVLGLGLGPPPNVELRLVLAARPDRLGSAPVGPRPPDGVFALVRGDEVEALLVGTPLEGAGRVDRAVEVGGERSRRAVLARRGIV
jgi:hypothetical protein